MFRRKKMNVQRGGFSQPGRGFIFFCFTLFSVNSFQSAAFAEVNSAQLSEAISAAITTVSTTDNILVDPKVTSEIFSDASAFTANFCDRDTTPCESVLREEVLTSILSGFFKDLNELPLNIETIASRMAHHEGKSMADAGWPDLRENHISVITLPATLADADISFITATKTVSLGHAGKLLYVQAGTQQLNATFRDGHKVYGTVSVAARSRGAWSETTSREQLLGDNVDPDPDLYCALDAKQNPGDPLQDPPLGLFNYGRSTIVEDSATRLANVIPAARQPGLDIKITDQTGRCNTECLNDIAVAFIQAISIWRSGCSRCTGNALVVLRFDDRIWIDSRAASRLRDTSAGDIQNVDYNLSHIKTNELQHYTHAPGYWQSGSFIVGYERIDQSESLKQSLCQLPDTYTIGWISLAKSYLCSNKTPQLMELSPELEITKGWTTCGDTAIACALPGGKIELTDNYSYWITDNDATLIFQSEQGTSRFDINAVLLHEVGHWFGLRHPETLGLHYEDIMQGTMSNDVKCVTPQSLVMLNNTTDLRWPYRAKDNQGLMPDIQ